VWPAQLFIEGWTIGLNLIPWRLRVCYSAKGSTPKEQAMFIGLGPNAGQGSYRTRTDACLNISQTDMPCYEWKDKKWQLTCCLSVAWSRVTLSRLAVSRWRKDNGPD
jgi:hypothetical protein